MTSPVLAQAPPNPLPCQQPISPNPEILTHNWLVDAEKRPPADLHLQTVTERGTPNARVTASHTFTFSVNFSKLGALFGPTNSNYLEGKFQDEQHRSADVTGLSQADFSKYNGAEQKAAPREMLDQLRVKYVDYIFRNHTLAEAGNKFTDINGNDPKTIHDLVNANQLPQLPIDRDYPNWQSGWGLYWNKIPTAYSEFYEAYIQFRAQHKARDSSEGNHISEVLADERCPYWLDRTIKFVMPEFFRTTATSGQLNQIIVPKAAQSNHANDLVLQNKPESLNSLRAGNGVLGKIIDTCLKAFKNNPVSQSLKKIISFAQDHFTPKVVYAEPFYPVISDDNYNPDCIRILVDGKEGQDPYCALPAGQGESCTNQDDEFKLDKDNPNVICTFEITWQREMVLRAGDSAEEFDVCRDLPDNRVSCDVAVSLWPIFEIPWQTEIWNNTLFSDTKMHEPFIGSPNSQEKGRPGVYSFFTPKAVFEDENQKKADNLRALLDACELPPDLIDRSTWPLSCRNLVEFADSADEIEYPGFQQCIIDHGLGPQPFNVYIDCANQFFENVIKELEKKKPGQSVSQSEDDARRRFIGGTDCSKEYVWHNALYPLAAQKEYGIINKCPLQAASQPVSQVPGSVSPPGSFPPTDNNCEGIYEIDNPVGNFGDPECDILNGRYDEDILYNKIATLDEENVDIWMCLAFEESSFWPNAYNPHSGDDGTKQAFGLFQMGHAAYPPGLDYQIADGQPNEYDRGDVDWQQQVTNAINYNNQYFGGDFRGDDRVSYWEPINDGTCPI